MQIKNLIPFGGVDLGRGQTDTSLFGLHRDIDRLFDGFFRQFGPGTTPLNNVPGTPRTDVAETDKAFEITVELPGLEEKDIEVSVTDDVLTVKGEKKEEHEEKRKDYHVAERFYGSFLRSIVVPAGVDSTKADARFKNGVLTVTLPKTAESETKVKRIQIKGA